MSDLGNQITPQQKELMTTMIKETFKNATFILLPDHRFGVATGMPIAPKDSYWAYAPATGIITVTSVKDQKKTTLQIQVSIKDGKTLFTLQKPSVILKVHKVS